MRSALKFLVFFLTIGLFFSFSFKPVHAQYYNSYSTPSTDPNVPKNLHTYAQSVLIEVTSAVVCQIIGIDPINSGQPCLGINPATKSIGFVPPGGAISAVGSLIAITLEPPIHTSDYTNYLTSNFGIAKPVLADTCSPSQSGTGYCGLSPLIKTWAVFRDLAYMFLIIIFILIGIAIMLRVKIDPRTVMTIQNQIPKIIIALVLVTLSFAIAGILIDLMWLLVYLLLNLFAKADPTGFNVPQITQNLSMNPLTFIDNVLSGNFGLAKIAINTSGSVATVIGNLLSFKSLPGHWWDIFSPTQLIQDFFAGLVAIIAFLAAILIVSIAMLVALVRVWFALLTAFITILIDVILAPLWIISGIIPGGGKGFSSWFRHIISRILLFPLTIAMFFIAKLFIDMFAVQASTTAVVPILGLQANASVIGSIVGFGVILVTPKAQSWLQDALKAPKTQGITTALFQSIGAGATAPKRLASFGAAAATTERKDGQEFYTYKGGVLGQLGRMFNTRR